MHACIMCECPHLMRNLTKYIDTGIGHNGWHLGRFHIVNNIAMVQSLFHSQR